MTSIIDFFSRKPGTLFLFDGLGAGFTACSLFLISGYFSAHFGMPPNMLTYLATIGSIYCAYSISCCFLLKSRWTPYLRIIGVSNVLYCMLTISLVYAHYTDLTLLGLSYLLGEVVIILSLAFIEFKVANKLTTKKI
ncbi:MAG: hypothetical protein IAE95_11110 [Chitinophagaceae bacterium]|nr:hypothetical protein [Chitinophagaceae bacterium]